MLTLKFHQRQEKATSADVHQQCSVLGRHMMTTWLLVGKLGELTGVYQTVLTWPSSRLCTLQVHFYLQGCWLNEGIVLQGPSCNNPRLPACAGSRRAASTQAARTSHSVPAIRLAAKLCSPPGQSVTADGCLQGTSGASGQPCWSPGRNGPLPAAADRCTSHGRAAASQGWVRHAALTGRPLGWSHAHAAQGAPGLASPGGSWGFLAGAVLRRPHLLRHPVPTAASCPDRDLCSVCTVGTPWPSAAAANQAPPLPPSSWEGTSSCEPAGGSCSMVTKAISHLRMSASLWPVLGKHNPMRMSSGLVYDNCFEQVKKQDRKGLWSLEEHTCNQTLMRWIPWRPSWSRSSGRQQCHHWSTHQWRMQDGPPRWSSPQKGWIAGTPEICERQWGQGISSCG